MSASPALLRLFRSLPTVRSPACSLPWCRDPYMGLHGAYLQRHEITLRLVAAVDVELASVEAGGAPALELQQWRRRLSLELDALLAGLQAHEVKEELLDSASELLGALCLRHVDT